MSGKSRHRRGKHSIHGKRKKGKLRHQVIVAQPQAVTQAEEPVSPPQAPVPSAKTATPAAPIAIKYPYILTELRRIGILAGIILAILIVLALVYA
jgi:hypothetical protein